MSDKASLSGLTSSIRGHSGIFRLSNVTSFECYFIYLHTIVEFPRPLKGPGNHLFSQLLCLYVFFISPTEIVCPRRVIVLLGCYLISSSYSKYFRFFNGKMSSLKMIVV
jgi:hypothetical protein